MIQEARVTLVSARAYRPALEAWYPCVKKIGYTVSGKYKLVDQFCPTPHNCFFNIVFLLMIYKFFLLSSYNHFFSVSCVYPSASKSQKHTSFRLKIYIFVCIYVFIYLICFVSFSFISVSTSVTLSSFIIIFVYTTCPVLIHIYLCTLFFVTFFSICVYFFCQYFLLIPHLHVFLITT